MPIARNISVWLICLFVLVAFVQPAATHTSAEIDVICPLCNTNFKSRADMSGTRVGMRLDLKPLGPIAAPWSVPKCPNCHFIVYNHEISDKDKKALLKLVNSKEYRQISADNSTYFLLAKIYETVGMSDLEIAHAYLKASWQVERDPAKYSKYLEASHEKFAAFVSSSKDKSTQYIMSELMLGEIERRLGRFDQAQNRFSRLQKLPEFSSAQHIAAIIGYQLELIEAKDSGPHQIKR
jgi:uncharacterized protein (DUF2225 family)